MDKNEIKSDPILNEFKVRPILFRFFSFFVRPETLNIQIGAFAFCVYSLSIYLIVMAAMATTMSTQCRIMGWDQMRTVEYGTAPMLSYIFVYMRQCRPILKAKQTVDSGPSAPKVWQNIWEILDYWKLDFCIFRAKQMAYILPNSDTFDNLCEKCQKCTWSQSIYNRFEGCPE